MEMESLIGSILFLLLVITLIAITIFLLGAIAIGIGYLFYLTFGLTLPASIAVSFASAFLLGIIAIVIILLHIHGHVRNLIELEAFEEEEESRDNLLKKMPFLNKAKIGQNDPCPCGSRKKYKNCCGKKR